MSRGNKTRGGAADELWAEAKRKCRLNAETLRMAKELGLAPRSLLKNVPGPSQQWKAPVHVWIREMYAKRRTGTRDPKHDARETPPLPEVRATDDLSDDFDVPDANCDPGWWSDTPPDLEESRENPSVPSAREVRDQRDLLDRERRHFRVAAERVAAALAEAPEVRRIVLFGSVAAAPRDELPRFREYRRAGILLPHECKDVDLAVWLDGLGDLDGLRKKASRSLVRLFEEEDIGVAHHQVDVFLLDTGSDRYLGRLCYFNRCPKGKPECLAPGCGTVPFLRQIENFSLRPDAIGPAHSVLLYDRDWLDVSPGDRASSRPVRT